MDRIVVAIDGPAASGKSSVGRAAASRLGLRFLDTGIMYRAVTWLALNAGQPVTDPAGLGTLTRKATMRLPDHPDDAAAIFVDGNALTSHELASAAVDRNVSAVAATTAVRRELVAQQRLLAGDGGIVMAGRDIGSVVLPDADLKLYLDASPEERARRRWRQQLATDPAASYERILADTVRRDCLDSRRADSPLMVPAGAVVIRTDGMDFAESVDAVVAAIKRVGAGAPGP